MISLPRDFKIKKESPNKAVFIVEGLYPGYGVTIGNSLRRVLLSSLGGGAITQVKIDKMPHEFSTLDGVKEDGVRILLNLKQVKFRVQGDEEFEAKLDEKGEKEVKAGDFEFPSQLEIVNPDQKIATITDKNASLKINVRVKKGIGFELSRSREDKDKEIGVIDLDAAYLPIENVSFKVENMRVGKRTDYDRLMLTIETDGRIDPEDAFRKAVEILIKHFNFLSEKEVEEVEEEEKETRDPSEIEIQDLDIPSRVADILNENRVKSVAGLTARTEENISEIEGIGPKSLEKIKKELQRLGLSLK